MGKNSTVAELLLKGDESVMVWSNYWISRQNHGCCDSSFRLVGRFFLEKLLVLCKSLSIRVIAIVKAKIKLLFGLE